MAKYYVRIESEKGKQVSVSGDEYVDIDIYAGNKRIASLTVRESDDRNGTAIYDQNDDEIVTTKQK